MSDMATILVVDDDPIVRDVVVRYLERDGHRTLVAGDGNHADELLRREALDLVVLDVMLPGRDGLALSRSIRSRSSSRLVSCRIRNGVNVRWVTALAAAISSCGRFRGAWSR